MQSCSPGFWIERFGSPLVKIEYATSGVNPCRELNIGPCGWLDYTPLVSSGPTSDVSCDPGTPDLHGSHHHRKNRLKKVGAAVSKAN